MLMTQLTSSLVYSGILLISSADTVPVTNPSLLAGSSPTFVVPSPSSNAARLLVEPKRGVLNPPNFPTAIGLQQLSQQRALQDARLEQCQEKQEEFEQCFFYGTGGIDRIDGMGLVGRQGLVGSRYPSNAGISSLGDSMDSPTGSVRKTKTAVPTW